MLLANFLFVMYYNVTIAKALVYVAAALEHVNDYLPWDYCHSKFNTECMYFIKNILSIKDFNQNLR